MKQRMLWLLATVMTLLGSHVTMAQHIVSDSIYIPPTMLPKATVYLPAPPDSVSPEFVDDLLQYQWGKSMRATERGEQAFRESYNLGWSEALVLAEVAPECQDEILRRGYQYGYNRLIVGYHWFTDIEATRQLSSALVARLHADPQFLDLMAAARAEYLEKTGDTTPVDSDKTMARPSGRSYRLDGTPATAQTRGIVIQDNRKTLRK